jgi:hypothetical protein
MNAKAILSASSVIALLATPATAHHSFAMFDRDKTLTLTGTVKEFQWTNPHAWIYMMVSDDSGKTIEYGLEMQGTGQATKNGWRPDSVKIGDKVTVTMHPLKSGSHGGQLLAVVLPDGQRLAVTGAPPSPLTGE